MEREDTIAAAAVVSSPGSFLRSLRSHLKSNEEKDTVSMRRAQVVRSTFPRPEMLGKAHGDGHFVRLAYGLMCVAMMRRLGVA